MSYYLIYLITVDVSIRLVAFQTICYFECVQLKNSFEIQLLKIFVEKVMLIYTRWLITIVTHTHSAIPPVKNLGVLGFLSLFHIWKW